MFERLVAAGYAVHAFDFVSAGRSTAHPVSGRFNISRWAELVDDAVAFSTNVLGEEHSSPVPAFILGCSVGALVALHVTLRMPEHFARGGLIMCYAYLDNTLFPFLSLLTMLLSPAARLLPNAPLVPAAPPCLLSCDTVQVPPRAKSSPPPDFLVFSLQTYPFSLGSAKPGWQTHFCR